VTDGQTDDNSIYSTSVALSGKSGSHDTVHSHLGTFCHAKANNWDSLPICKLWPL